MNRKSVLVNLSLLLALLLMAAGAIALLLGIEFGETITISFKELRVVSRLVGAVILGVGALIFSRITRFAESGGGQKAATVFWYWK